MDLSKVPDSQRQELEQLQKQFHQHQQQQQTQPAYDPFQVYDHPYNNQSSYYQNYYANSLHYPQQRNEEDSRFRSLGLGQVSDPYHNLGGAAAAAAMAALSQLTRFAGGPHHDQSRLFPVGHAPYRGGGRRGGGPSRGGGHGNYSFQPPNTGIPSPTFHGKRGRSGRGRDGRRGPPSDAPSSQPESSAQANAQPPVRIAWCELCRVDCTSQELLDQHKNGRRHKKNLQRLQDKKAAYQPFVETKQDEKPSSDTGFELNKNIPVNEPDKETTVGDDNNILEKKENDNQEKKLQMKRRMRDRVRGGRGGAKRMRPAGPRIRKVVIPLMCDLCNIKCDTQEVFDKHTVGKKHIAKLRRFEGHQAMYGATAVQALYPPNPLSQTLAPQPATYLGAPSIYPAPPEAYMPPPYQDQNPNPQLADAPLEFGTQTHAGNGV